MIACTVSICTALLAAGPGPAEELLTVAEASGFRATARHAEVVSLLERIAERSAVMHLSELGRSVEGRALPLAILADPPVASAAEALASGKLRVLAFGNIHAGEVCGKEALLMLARELALEPGHPLLRDLIILLVPILNADGNERVSPDNRPGQLGPAEGMGERANAQGLDLNRDWVKLEAPETRAMVRLLTEWDPHLTIDTHTTNGSRHRYALTWAPPLNPSGHPPSIAFVRDELLPEVARRLRDRAGYDTFAYGDFDEAQRVWATYSADPRYGGPYRGLRGQMSILSEAYAYSEYRDRVLVTLEFVREILSFAAEHAGRIAALHEQARRDVIAAGRHPQPDDVVGIRHRPAAFPQPAVVRGYAPGSDEPADHVVVHLGRFESVAGVRRPHAYLLEPGLDAVAAKLREHGIELGPFAGSAHVETYTIDRIDRAERPFQGHCLVRLEATARDRRIELSPGAWMVRLDQPLGTLAAYLLEPEAADGLAAWNLLDEHLAEGGDFPVHRVPSPRDLAVP